MAALEQIHGAQSQVGYLLIVVAMAVWVSYPHRLSRVALWPTGIASNLGMRVRFDWTRDSFRPAGIIQDHYCMYSDYTGPLLYVLRLYRTCRAHEDRSIPTVQTA